MTSNKIKMAVFAAFALFTTLTFASGRWPVFEAFTATPRAYADRNEDASQRNTRGKDITKAIELASPDTHTQTALLALADVESLFTHRIQVDKCLPDECDGGLARGIWQLQKSACPQIWGMDPSFDRLKIEAECARDTYYAAIERCNESHPGRPYAAGLNGYRGPCKNSDDAIRQRAFKAYQGMLVDGVPKAPSGWVRDQDPKRAHRKKALQMIKTNTSKPGTFIRFDGVGALVEWHWHDPSRHLTPKGWHVGLSLYKKEQLTSTN